MVKVLHLIPRLNYFGGTAKKLRFLLSSDGTAVCHFCAVGSLEGSDWLGLENIFSLSGNDKIGMEVKSVIHIINENRIDLIVAHFFHMSMVAYGVSLKTGISFVYQDHGIDIGETLIKYPLRILMMMRAKLIVLNSYATIRVFLQKYPVVKSKYRVIYNGITTPVYSDTCFFRSQLSINSQVILVGMIGGYLKWRRHEILLEAFKNVVEKVPNIHLALLGEGGEEDRIKRLVEKKNRNVHFIPRSPFVGNFLAEIDVYVNPSVSEGFGIATCEAMLLGKPVIVANSGAFPEYCSNMSNSILVIPDNVESLTEAILLLVNDEELRGRLGQQAAKDIALRFTPQLYVANNNAVCSEALSI